MTTYRTRKEHREHHLSTCRTQRIGKGRGSPASSIDVIDEQHLPVMEVLPVDVHILFNILSQLIHSCSMCLHAAASDIDMTEAVLGSCHLA